MNIADECVLGLSKVSGRGVVRFASRFMVKLN
jgi:hypothetical protein